MCLIVWFDEINILLYGRTERKGLIQSMCGGANYLWTIFPPKGKQSMNIIETINEKWEAKNTKSGISINKNNTKTEHDEKLNELFD